MAASSELINPTGSKKTAGGNDMFAPAMQMSSSLTKRIKMNAQANNILGQIAGQTKQDEEIIVLVVCGLVCAVAYLFSGFSIFTGLVAWMYPLYKSGQAVRDEDAETCKTWLKYWIVYGVVSFSFYWFADLLLFPVLGSLYPIAKLFAYGALWHPTINGADRIFSGFILPILEKNRD